MKLKSTELSRIIVILEDEWAAGKMREAEAKAEGRKTDAVHWEKKNAELDGIINKFQAELDEQLKLIARGVD